MALCLGVGPEGLIRIPWQNGRISNWTPVGFYHAQLRDYGLVAYTVARPESDSARGWDSNRRRRELKPIKRGFTLHCVVFLIIA